MINKLLFTLLLSSLCTLAHGSTKSERFLEQKRAINDRTKSFLLASDPEAYLEQNYPECQAKDTLIALRQKYWKAHNGGDIEVLQIFKQAKDILYPS